MGLDPFTSGFGLDEVTTKSGRRKAEAQEQQLDIGELQLRIAEELYGNSGGLRDSSVAQLGSLLNAGVLPPAVDIRRPDLAGLDTFLETGQLPTAVQGQPLPAVPVGPSVPDLTAAKRDVLEQQFNVARNNVITQAPTQGGALAQSLTDLEAQRALGVAQLAGTQRDLQYQQDLQRTQEQYQQDLGAAQRQQDQAARLYGVGLDINREQANIENQTRRALFASAVGTAFGQPDGALTGLAGANTSFGSVATAALEESLKKQKAAQNTANFAMGFGAGKGGKGGGASGGGGAFG